MSRLTKILTGIVMAAIAVAVVSVPVKADAASEAYEAGLKQLEQIAKETEISAAANEAAAKEGLRLALARQAELDAAAKAGMTTGQAFYDIIEAQTKVSMDANRAAANEGLRLALARQAELDAAAKAGMVSGHALHEQIAKETAASAAALYAAAASGLAK